jgi:hypothetical protein
LGNRGRERRGEIAAPFFLGLGNAAIAPHWPPDRLRRQELPPPGKYLPVSRQKMPGKFCRQPGKSPGTIFPAPLTKSMVKRI